MDDALPGVLIRLHYLWSPRHVPGDAVPEPHDNDNTPYNYAGELLADAAVASLMYHLPANDTLGSHLPALSRIAQHAPLMWITTPTPHDEAYVARNQAMRAWVAQTANASTLALDKLAADGTYVNVDGHHFACSVDVDKDAKHQNQCNDVFDTVNANLVQMVLNTLAKAW